MCLEEVDDRIHILFLPVIVKDVSGLWKSKLHAQKYK